MSVVRFTLELAGDVSSFTPSVRTEMKGAIAARAGVDPSAVELTISPGSVLVDVSIQTSAVTAALAQATMASAASSPSSATAMLASVTGVSIAVLAVVTPPTVADVPPPPPPSPSPPPPMSPMPTGASALETGLSTDASAVETSGSKDIIIGVIAGVNIFLVLALILIMRRRSKVEPDHEPDAPRAQRARVSASGLDDVGTRIPGEIPQAASTVVSMLIDQRGETDGQHMQVETYVEEYLDR
jgi:hypothetical protein